MSVNNFLHVTTVIETFLAIEVKSKFVKDYELHLVHYCLCPPYGPVWALYTILC
jgi:hypothetical protein